MQKREIKFRCWHRSGKHLGGRRFAPAMIYDDKPGDCLVWLNQGQDIEAVMQYTGLKDKDGKEIYENDIVNVRNWGRTDDILHVAQIVWDGQIGGWNFEPFFDVDEYDRFRNLEVIGNIFENPIP